MWIFIFGGFKVDDPFPNGYTVYITRINLIVRVRVRVRVCTND